MPPDLFVADTATQAARSVSVLGPRSEIRTVVRRAVFLSVMEDRRLLGVPEKTRDQIVTWAFNAAMDYDRKVTNPATLVLVDENMDIVIDAMEMARGAGVMAYARCVA